MRVGSLIFCLFMILTHNGLAQDSWLRYNDSAFRSTKKFYDTCSRLRSSEKIPDELKANDRRLIRVVNQLYNDSSFGYKELKRATANFKRNILRSGDGRFIFYIETDGNIRLAIWLDKRKRKFAQRIISIETKTTVLCDDKGFTVNNLDFIYLYNFLNLMDFPATIKPFQAELMLKRF
jgi:hypothetical protein